MADMQEEQQGASGIQQMELPRNPLTEQFKIIENIWRRTVLSYHLVRDDRVPLGAKVIPALAIAYVVSPLDLIPSLMTGPLGVIDDVILVGFALDIFIRMVDEEIVLEYARKLNYVS